MNSLDTDYDSEDSEDSMDGDEYEDIIAHVQYVHYSAADLRRQGLITENAE